MAKPKSKKLTSDEATRKRWFALGSTGTNTHIQMIEYSDSSIEIQMSTRRDGMEPLVTGLRLTPATFYLLTEALSRAAHDNFIWKCFEEQP